MYLAQIDIDQLIREDVPYFDLTSFSLRIDQQQTNIACFTRQDCVVCGTEEADAVFHRLGIETVAMQPSGTTVKAGTDLITGTGKAVDVFTAWKVIQNLIDHTSGIATKTRRLVDAARAVNPDISILTTRKMFPGTKALAIKAIMAGGAMPHRLGLSETILIFPHHINMLGGKEAFLEHLSVFKRECCEKKILVETNNAEDARRFLQAGADGLQFEKLAPAELAAICDSVAAEFPGAILLATGGVNEDNVAEYASARIDGIVTTSLYTAKPVDVGVRITPAGTDINKTGR